MENIAGIFPSKFPATSRADTEYSQAVESVTSTKLPSDQSVKKCLLEMSPQQFTIDDLINPLVSLRNLPSDEEMEVDDPNSCVEEGPDSDIEVLVCFKEIPHSRQQTIAGRLMTTDTLVCQVTSRPDRQKRNLQDPLLS